MRVTINNNGVMRSFDGIKDQSLINQYITTQSDCRHRTRESIKITVEDEPSLVVKVRSVVENDHHAGEV